MTFIILFVILEIGKSLNVLTPMFCKSTLVIGFIAWIFHLTWHRE